MRNCPRRSRSLRSSQLAIGDSNRVTGKTPVNSDREKLEGRTKAFAVRVIRFVAALPKNRITDVLGPQFLRAGTSVGANYREANRAESRNDFIHKVGLVEKEAAESQFWLELFDEVKIGDETERAWLLKEATELLAIFTSIGKTAKARRDA